MIVIADTSPLNYLILLGHSELLPLFYGHISVPQAVLLEMQHKRAPIPTQNWSASPPRWLEVRSVKRLDNSLGHPLGTGEREAISLALELKADVLLIDDLAGRRDAGKRGIAVAGTLAVLLQASVRGLLEFPSELHRLHQFGFRSSLEVQADMMARYEASKKQLS